MAHDAKKRQQKLQRKAAKRKEKRQLVSRVAHIMRAPSLSKAGEWPLREVLLSEEWGEEGALTQILIGRTAPTGHVAVGMFLVDLGCLGVKNADGFVGDVADYDDRRRHIMKSQKMIAADLNLVAKIIREGVGYAKDLGFSPHRDYYKAIKVLGDADPDACDEAIPLGGPEGKPFFVAGPYDDVNKVIAKLTKAVGSGGFHLITPLADPNAFADFLDEDEELYEVRQ